MMAVMMTPRKLPSYFATEEEQRHSPAANAQPVAERGEPSAPPPSPAALTAPVRPLRAL